MGFRETGYETGRKGEGERPSPGKRNSRLRFIRRGAGLLATQRQKGEA